LNQIKKIYPKIANKIIKNKKIKEKVGGKCKLSDIFSDDIFSWLWSFDSHYEKRSLNFYLWGLSTFAYSPWLYDNVIGIIPGVLNHAFTNILVI